MSNVVVMTDTVACIPQNIAEKYNIKIVPAAHIHYNGKQYIDGVNLSAAQAYQFIKKDPDRFITSAITPAYVLEELTRASKESNNILFITLSSALSAASKTVSIAAGLLKEESPHVSVKILDSKTVASSQGLIVLAAARAAKTGLGLSELVSFTDIIKHQTYGFMMLDTLRYVYRTGRMSKLGSKIASMFNIKPINKVTEEGKIEMVDRTRNTDHGLERLIELIKETIPTNSLRFMVTHADDIELANQFAEMLKKQFDCLDLVISDYSPVMGYGAGPGAIFVGFQPEIDLLK
jgi:DegV family protein with EDD domain